MVKRGMQLEDINLSPLKNALDSLETGIGNKTLSDLERDGVIQRFEYTFELSWKVLKKYFKANNNIQIDSIKQIFREAGKQNLISSVENWFEYLKARNNTTHTYDQSVAKNVFDEAKRFAPDARELILNLEEVLG